jgi:peptidylprolyl isomerase/FKBP-type peptidyl-prolyl cis-trans isomerase FkpA
MRFAALLVLVLACQPTQTATPRPLGIPLAQLPDESRGDPLCGPNAKWTGTRCIRSDVKPTTTGGLVGIQINDITLGSGQEAKMGDLVSVDYTGTLRDGTVFDSSRPRGKPFQFRLGASQVIKGFERGIVGMKQGGVRRITIPPDLGYGKKGMPPAVPPNATLVFEVELVTVGNE